MNCPGRNSEKQETLLGRGDREESSRTPGMWLEVSGFTEMQLVSGLSLANHLDSVSFLVAHTSLSQDEFQCKGFSELGRTYHLLPPLLLYSWLGFCWQHIILLSRPPVVRQLRQVVIIVWPLWVISVNGSRI